MTQAIVVRTHDRAQRRDRVGDMLRAAAHLRKPRTLNDWVTVYSREHDDPTLPKGKDGSINRDRIIWHLDPVERRSVITQAQARLRQERKAVVITDKHGVDHELERAVAPGEFAHLLGPKLRPSLATDSKPGKKEPRWCEGVQAIPDTEAPIDGMKNPMIEDLLDLATAATDFTFANGNAIREIARMPKVLRATVIAEKKRDYAAAIRRNAQSTELQRKLERSEAENLRLTTENTEFRQRFELLEGIDLSRLARDYGAGDAGQQAQ